MRQLTVSEAAEALNLSVPTIKRYIYEGKLHSTKLPGGQHRIPESEIDRLLAPEGADTASPTTGAELCAEVEDRVDVLERWVTDLQAEVERLQATLEVMSRYCARVQAEGAPPKMEPKPTDGHHVLVLGPGCKRCDALYEATARVLEEAGRSDVTLERVKHLDDIAEFGPILTPALVINDQLVLSGRVPSEGSLRKTIERHLG